MLQTIKIPKNLNFLSDKLPKPNYNPVKVIQLDRKNFFNTIGGGGVENSQSIENNKRLPKIGKKITKIKNRTVLIIKIAQTWSQKVKKVKIIL